MVPLLRVFHVRDARLPVIGALVALAWLTLAIWGQSPYGRYLDHGQWLQSGFVGGFVGTICRAVPAGTALFAGLVYVAAWLLMTVAMMLPTTMPLLAIFARMTADRDDRGLLLTLVVAGYLSIWTAFGLIAHLADMSLHAAVATNVFLSVNSWINEHWRGQAVRRQSFLLGLHHGLFCVGCCWAIMLLMFLVGTGSVGWMLMIGAVMALEKNARWGRRLSASLGVVLLLASTSIVALNL